MLRPASCVSTYCGASFEWESVTLVPTAHNAASGQCKYALHLGSGSSAKREVLEFHLFIVASGKVICLLSLFLKMKGKSLVHSASAEYKSVCRAVFGVFC